VFQIKNYTIMRMKRNTKRGGNSLKSITVPAKMEYLDDIMNLVERILEQTQIAEQEKTRVLISAEEIFTNIASYAYGERAGNVQMTCEVNVEKIKICFRDQGIEYNPLERPDPNFNIPFEDRPIGGLGVYMVKKYMDHVSYRRDDDSNVLTIEKRL